ncbi:MAG TPA: hypothetical protein VE570_07650 [Thermoleophilaceae bacterium]|nr:hypothetical protein [Thermoleophilaceae bacterium]
MRGATAGVACFVGLSGSAFAATPIPEGANSLPSFAGKAATPSPVFAPEPPRNPHMAPNGRSNIHNDAYMTDTYQGAGPLGRGIARTSTFLSHECASLTFDSRDRIVAICVGLEAPIVQMFDPKTLDSLASMVLPPRTGLSTGVFTDFSGGGYFYLDDKDRVIAPTNTRHLYVIAETDGPGFELQQDYDLTSVVPQGDKIISALPDWSGRIWFASTAGVVGFVDPVTGAVKSRDLKEPNGNSFAVDDSGGAYIVTDNALYRFDASPSGVVTTWRETYDNIGVKKPGQTQAGSGTTPTVMGPGYVAITDNADPMNVVVYKRASRLAGSRLVCKAPVFAKGASNTDQSLIATPTSIVAENNYGYANPAATQGGKGTTPGLERIDVDAKGCRKVWHSDEVAPSVVPKLSLANGIVYTYTKPPRADGQDGWYLTALDFATGKTLWKALAGEGLGYNNNYAPVTLGPDGSAYVGVLGGLVRLADRARASAPRATPKLRLNARRLRDGRLRLSLGGVDRRYARKVEYKAGKKRLGSSSKSPFRIVAWTRDRRLRALVTTTDGRHFTATRTLK